jgi:FAD/FMN-containing dehydrogenase
MMTMHNTHFIDILGTQGVRSGDALTGFDVGFDPQNLTANFAVLPSTTHEVAEVLRYCVLQGLSVVPQGGRTGLSGAARSSAGQVIVMMQRMANIVAIDAISHTAIVEAGCTLQALEEAVRQHGLTCGIDLGARGTATLGGMIATNAGGQEAFRFGPMRQRILGLEVVLPDGRVLGDLTQVIKANGGYDIKQLFIGSEGTLGIVTRACLRLSPYEAPGTTALVSLVDLNSGIRLFRRLEALSHGRLLRAELMSGNHVSLSARDHGADALAQFGEQGDCAIFEFTDHAVLEAELGLAFEEGLISDALLCKNEKERAAVWKIREDWAVDRAFPQGLWFDLSVPLAGMGTYIEALHARLHAHDPDLQLFYIGHMGDGNLHVTINKPAPMTEHYKAISALVYDGLTALGGFFSAEHGIGLEKQEALAEQSDPVKLALMRDIKRLIDPSDIMNPGKVLQP